MKKERTITQICEQCIESYIPKRKGTQRFCSASCRSRYWFLKQQSKAIPEIKLQEIKNEESNSIDKMSMSGVGNSFWGSLAAEVVTGVAKSALTRDADLPATKGDIKILLDKLNQRFLPVQNVSHILGKRAFYDKTLLKIVFYNEQLKIFELPRVDLS